MGRQFMKLNDSENVNPEGMISGIANTTTLCLKKGTPNCCFIAIIILGHLHAIFFYGATFWVDSEAYVYLSRMFTSAQNTQDILADPELWLYSAHIPLGESLAWFLVSKLPTPFIWPAMALIQHGCGVLAQGYLFTTLNRMNGNILLLIPCLLMSFLPFYQAMHNSLMTEALSGACFLVALSSCLRLAYCPRKRDYIFLALSGLGAFFRAYLVVTPFISIFVLFIWRKISFRKVLLVGSGCGIGLLLTPVWVFFSTGQLWIPTLGVNAMWQSSVFAPSAPPAVKAYVDTLSWPDESVKQRLLGGTFTRFDTVDTSIHWHDSGLTKQQAFALSQTIASLFDKQPGIWKRRISAALTCMGLAGERWLPIHWQHRRQPDPETSYQHQISAYKYFSWIAPDEKQYTALSSMPYYNDGPEHNLLKDAWKPYLNFSSPEWLRDVFFLAMVAPYCWFLLALLAFLFLLFRKQYLICGLLSCNFFAIFLVFYATNIPSIRYSYLPILLYITTLAISTLPIGKRYK